MIRARRVLPGRGVALALLAAAGFGTSGSFATALTSAGWSSGAAVTARISLAVLVLTPFALVQLRDRWPMLRAQGPTALWDTLGTVLPYGAIAVAASQLAFFNAVQHIDVGVALLLEYLGIVLVVLYTWLRHGQRPRALTVVGAATALVGLLLVLDISGGATIDRVGVLWGLGAGVGLALFYVLSARTVGALPPLTLAWAGMLVGAVVLVLLGVTGLLPLRAALTDVSLGGRTVSWVVPVLGLSVLAAALSYVAGIGAVRALGARPASFLGLTEVLFAILFAWLLLGQLPTGMQLLGSAVILAGVTLVRVDERDPVPVPEPAPAGSAAVPYEDWEPYAGITEPATCDQATS